MSESALINWGSYDVDNFGDLLFPFLVEHFLSPRYARVLHVSPTGTRSIWPDAVATMTIAEALTHGPFAGLVIGGGNLVSWTTSASKNYSENQAFARIVHPSFCWVPYVLRAKHGVPYAFNYVGVSKEVPNEKRELTRLVLAPAALIACREAAGARRLADCGVNGRVSVGPDSAIDISKVFSSEELCAHYHQHVREQYGIPTEGHTVVVHIKQRYLKEQFAEVNATVRYLQQRGMHPVLMPLGVCHGDDVVLDDARLAVGAATVVRKSLRLRDMLSMIAVSRYYIGSSLHGAMTALSYGNRIALVADEQGAGLVKFSGFLAHVGLEDCLFGSWRDAVGALAEHGIAVFGELSAEKRRVLGARRDGWNDIACAFERAGRARMSLDRRVEEWVATFYGV